MTMYQATVDQWRESVPAQQQQQQHKKSPNKCQRKANLAAMITKTASNPSPATATAWQPAYIAANYDVDGTRSQCDLNAITKAIGITNLNYTHNRRAGYALHIDTSQAQVTTQCNSIVRQTYSKLAISIPDHPLPTPLAVVMIAADYYTANIDEFDLANPARLSMGCVSFLARKGFAEINGKVWGKLNGKDALDFTATTQDARDILDVVKTFKPSWLAQKPAKKAAEKKPHEFARCCEDLKGVRLSKIKQDTRCPFCGQSLARLLPNASPALGNTLGASDYSKSSANPKH